MRLFLYREIKFLALLWRSVQLLTAYDVPSSMRADFLSSRFWEEFRKNKSLYHALWRLATPTFVPAGAWELLYVTSRVSLPLSLRQFLLVLEQYPGQNVVRQGIPWVRDPLSQGDAPIGRAGAFFWRYDVWLRW